ncbi:PhoX family protein [Streptomyces radicis]|uniref:PhoX family phosphatase n=1 Tax=Streptomyces radicis TaxID=1750517 RepID=A0A3A9VRH5_9ACTN|nr:PhoX family phosphatase [Streptomyces radicis]RKN03645.1 PhoX family phosphatase [Streptomyces radicis]RKN13489.1 PhoX family phosphatase [Streptomyces radicis]
MSAQRPVFPEFDPDDVSSNSSANRTFGEVVGTRMSRRAALKGGTAAAAGFLVAASAASPAAARTPVNGGGDGGWESGHRPTRLLGFTGVPTSTDDDFTVPDGYRIQVLIPWGTPIRPGGPRWREDGSNSAEEQAEQIGMNHDGMHFFPLGAGRESSRRGLLVLNHEYVDQSLLFPDGADEITAEKVGKALAAHGVSIVEIEKRRDGEWRVVDSRRARRVTGTTPVEFSGPVQLDHPSLASHNDPMGTLNNCSSGATPWGTYLTCEENWNNYFGTEDESWEPTPSQARYGVSATGGGYRWHEAEPRFDIAANPNEVNRFGWIVEIDPEKPRGAPVKRTALGRFKHEGCTVTESRGKVVAYSGDDQDGDYIYKFVGEGSWRVHRALGRSPLDHGTLYVARFEDDGSGSWLPLTHGTGALTTANGWADQADVLLRTREAADAVGATKMDRPEWIAVNPKNQDVYCTLTNGSGWDNAVNPRKPNPYGHIVRWTETGRDNAALTFEWDIFLLAGDQEYDDRVDLGANIFGSPDGLGFDREGRLWIQTDVSNSVQNSPSAGYDNIGNNQMLAGDPRTGEVRRFLTGPRGAEISGITFTPDHKTMFVNVQHPGESTGAWGTPTPENPRAVSNWPDFDPTGRPRSATVVVRRTDGGVIGAA